MPATTEQDVSLVVAPLSHGAGVHALPQVARGAATVLLSGERLDCEEAWRLVERHRVTNMFTVPTILTMLTRHEAVDRYDHSSLRYVIYAGAPMYRADQVHALRKLGNVLVQYFGMGEVTGNITVLPRELHSIERRRDAGRKLRLSAHRHGGGDPRPGRQAAAARNHRRDLRAWARRVRRLSQQSRGDGEGDAVRLVPYRRSRPHGRCRASCIITGRASDMYISGGSNVYPREIEEALLLHPVRRRSLRGRHAGRAMGRKRRRGAGRRGRRGRSTNARCWRISTAGWRNTNGRRGSSSGRNCRNPATAR